MGVNGTGPPGIGPVFPISEQPLRLVDRPELEERVGTTRLRGFAPYQLMALLALPWSGCSLDPADMTEWRTVGEEVETRSVAVPDPIGRDRLVLESLTSVGSEEGEGYLEDYVRAVRDDAGRFWVLQPAGPKLFTDRGKYIGQVGQFGEGPGEFAAPAEIFTDKAGNVHILDGGNARESVYRFRDLELIAERPLPGWVMSAAPTSNGYVASMHVPGGSEVVPPMHIVRGDSVAISFGEPELRGTSAVLRRLAVDTEGWIYSARPYEYAINVWDPNGRPASRFERVGLFEPIPRRQPGEPRIARPVFGEITALRMDAAGLLWVAGKVAKGGAQGPAPSSAEDYVGVLEVIDLGRASLVATRELDWVISGFLDDRTVYGVTYDEVGTPSALIARLALGQ